jgi:deoxyribodipyrimidine photolyase-related protein
MSAAGVVFPHQLFEKHPLEGKIDVWFIVESDLFFTQLQFHKIKLAFHRLSMQRFAENLIQKGYKVQYIEFHDSLSNAKNLSAYLSQKFHQIHTVDLIDDWLTKHLKLGLQGTLTDLITYENPSFLTPPSLAHEFFNSKKRYFQTDFYSFQRKRLNILMDEQQKPLGGKLTFDADNRKSFPKNHIPPQPKFPSTQADFQSACDYIEKYFPNNPGTFTYFKNRQQFYPTTPSETREFLNDFLQNRMPLFGDLEDAFSQNPEARFVYHSVLSPMLNAGLITPTEVIETTLEFHSKNALPMNALEGFIRQIIGWREFVRMIYIREGSKQRNSNFLNFQRQIPASFYNGTTGIEPIDNVIKNLLETGYSHHIERLMVIGNFFLLCEIHPHEVYKWFMELYIDAYDWVMVPNIYGMSQFADGGLMVSKPYFSGSNYILKMSDYPKTKQPWQKLWDALFWRFMNEHRQFLQHNPRLGMLIITYDKMSVERKSEIIEICNLYFSKDLHL